MTETSKHSRQIGQTDGIISDDVAVRWSDLEDDARRWGATGRHRAQDHSRTEF